MRTAYLAFVIIAFVSTANAQSQRQSGQTGQTLEKLCTGSATALDECDAYISGIADAAYFYQILRPADESKGGRLPGYICIPPATTGRQLRETVVRFTQRRANEAGRPASAVVLSALDDAFSCSKTK